MSGERCIVCDEWMGEYCCMSCGNTEYAPEEDGTVEAEGQMFRKTGEKS